MDEVMVRPDLLPIALRAYVVPRKGQRAPYPRGKVPPPPTSLLCLDMETTVDPSQRLTFGSFQQCSVDAASRVVCMEEGLIYDDALPERDPEGYARLQRYAATRQSASTSPRFPELRLWSRREFLEERLGPAIRGGTLILGYNLPFDLSRLAVDVTPARKKYTNGFSLTLFDYLDAEGLRREDRFHPRFCFKPLGSKRSMMGFAERRRMTVAERRMRGKEHGRLLDLQHLVFALSDKHLSLDNAAQAFGLPDRKIQGVEHGVITDTYIDYNRRDVALTVRLYEVVMAEWNRHALPVSPETVMSPASISKGCLRAMGVIPPREKFRLPRAFLGAAMGAYFGGRSEVRVRRVPVPVAYLDFRSMYPSVNVLMEMWKLVTAAKLTVVPATRAVRKLMANLTLAQCTSPTLWPELRWFAKIRPQGDILPVRAKYNDSLQGTSIGVNPLWSDTPIWVAGPDLVASWLATGRVPEILVAVRLVPVGRQKGLRPIKIRGELEVDPRVEDLFQRLVELRATVRDSEEYPKAEQERMERTLKVLANSGSYGIFAELNTQPRSAAAIPAMLYGIDGGHKTSIHAVEEPGEFWCGPQAALCTAAARMMLALLDRLVADRGGQIAFGDTDSAAVVCTPTGGLVPCPGGPERMPDGREAIRALSRAQVQEVIDAFEPLNPYNRTIIPGSILRDEGAKFTAGTPEQWLYAFAISAKRYALFTFGPRGEPNVVDAKEHGLGHLMNPAAPELAEKEWIPVVWDVLIRQALGLPVTIPAWVHRPAMTRITVTSVPLWEPYQEWNAGKPYGDQIKPMNFGLSPIVASGMTPPGVPPERFHLFGVYERDASRWLEMEYTDRYSGNRYQVGIGADVPCDRVPIKSIEDVMDAYRQHPEAKFLGPDGLPCHAATIGLLRHRPVHIESIVYIGKESNAVEEVEQGLVHDIEDVQPRLRTGASDDWDLVVLPALRRVPLDRLVVATGLSSRAIRYYWDCSRRPNAAVEAVLRTEARRWARNAVKRKGVTAEDRQVAERLLALIGQGGPRRPPARRRRRRAQKVGPGTV